MQEIDNIIQKYTDCLFTLNEGLNDDKFVKLAQKRLGASFKNALDNSPELQNKAAELGINPDYNSKDYIQARSEAFPQLNISPEVTDKVKKVIEILKKITKKQGGNNWSELQTMINNGETYGMGYNEIMRMKDFIDSQDLRYMYDSSINPGKKTYMKFGNKVDAQGNLDDSGFDLNTVLKSHFGSWYSGTRKEKWTPDEAYIELKRTVLNRYLMSEYGIEADVPNFDLGNKKVKGALIVNFTSAFRCPAWNECLVKHACYARKGEGQHYENQFTSNTKKNLMWEAGRVDATVWKMIIDMLKTYIIDYGKTQAEILSLVRANKKNPEFKEFLSKVGPRVNMETFAQLEFKEMPEEIREIVNKHARVHDIRLNENGDFISDWFLKSFDKVAEDFKLVGVNSAAYSCRNLNFDGIKNIVINASRINMKGEAIARYFFAIPETMYDAFEDTYASMGISDEFNAIDRLSKPLYDLNGRPNGNFYYKCPCAREDFKINGTTGQEISCYQCHLCYEAPSAEIQNKLRETGGKLIVFVKAHGTMANQLDPRRAEKIAKSVGVCKGYNYALTDNGMSHANDQKDMDFDEVDESIENTKVLKESIGNDDMHDEAYEIIANNAIMSMNEHLSGVFNNTISEQKQKFMNIFNKLI